MFNVSTAIEREFQPRYSFSWYMTKLFLLVIAGAYVVSKVRGEKVEVLIEVLGIGALIGAAFSIALTIKAIEFGTKLKLHYILWPTRSFDYKNILEVRLPEIAITSRTPLKLENIVNLDELQQEFQALELMGVIQRGHVKELKPLSSKYSFKPKLGNVVLALFTAFTLGNELFKISKGLNALWLGIIVIYFASDVLDKLFRKSKDE